MLINDAVRTASNTLRDWGENISQLWPNFLVAFIILILFFLFAKIIKKIFRKIFKKLNVSESVTQLIISILSVVLFSTGIIVALEVLKLEKTVTSLLAGAGIIGLALGLSFQDIVTNIISGVTIAVKKPFEVGDVIDTNGFSGIVKRIKLRIIELDNFNGQEIIIPCRDILQKPIINYSRTGVRKMIINACVSFNSNLDHVRKIALEAINGIDELLPDLQKNIYFKEFGAYGINFSLIFWVKYNQDTNFLQIQNRAIEVIKQSFDNNGIKFPIQSHIIERL